MFCTKCGAEIIDDIYVCNECNNDMSRFDVTENTDAKTNDNNAEALNDDCLLFDLFDEITPSTPMSKPKKKKSVFFKKLIFAAVFCFIASFLYFRYIDYFESTNPHYTETASQPDNSTSDSYIEPSLDYSEYTAFILSDGYDAGNLRTLPGLDSEVLAVVLTNEVMYFMNEEQYETAHSITWYKVYHENSGNTGFISSKLLTRTKEDL